MYNILISAAASSGVVLISAFALNFAWWSSLLVGVVVFGLMFVMITKMILNKVMASFAAAEKDLQAKPPRFEKAIKELEAALKHSKWQLLVKEQIESQIGMLYYMRRDFSNSFPHLQKSYVKNWAATTMLAISYMKRKNMDKMISTFEFAVQWSGKEPLAWAVYAYCMKEVGEADKVIEILNRGIKKNAGNEKLQELLKSVENGKRMNMRSYGESWFQFHLESQAVLQKYQMASMGGRTQQRMSGRMQKAA